MEIGESSGRMEVPLGWWTAQGSLAWLRHLREQEIWVEEGMLSSIVHESDEIGGEMTREWRSPWDSSTGFAINVNDLCSQMKAKHTAFIF